MGSCDGNAEQKGAIRGQFQTQEPGGCNVTRAAAANKLEQLQ
jgi:hypothetical protein